MISHPIKIDDHTIEVRICTERDDLRESLGLEVESVSSSFYKDTAYLRITDDAGNEATFELADAQDIIEAITDVVQRVDHERALLKAADGGH